MISSYGIIKDAYKNVYQRNIYKKERETNKQTNKEMCNNKDLVKLNIILY